MTRVENMMRRRRLAPSRGRRFVGAALVLALAATAGQAYTLGGPGEPSRETFSGYGGLAAPPQWTLDRATFRGSSDGASPAAGWYSFGATLDVDRALGFLGNSSQTTITWSACWTNSTGAAVDELTIAYRAERWRQAGRWSALQAGYAVDGADLTPLPDLDFQAPSVGVEQATDGNAKSHSANLSTRVGGLDVRPGSRFELRWTYHQGDGAGGRQALAIDDLSVTVGSGAFLQFCSASEPVAEGAGTALVWVAASGVHAATASVFVVGSGAMPEADFRLVTTALVFDARTSSQAVEVVIIDDGDADPGESFILGMDHVRGAALVAGKERATLAIADDDQPYVAFSQPSVTVSEDGPPAVLALVISYPADATVRVDCAGAARPGIDYVLSSTSVIFHASGPRTNQLLVCPMQDRDGEGDEGASLTLRMEGGAAAGVPAGCDMLLRDDEPVVTWHVPEWLVTEEGQGGVALEMALSFPYDATVQVACAGAAILGADYHLSASTVVFSAGGDPVTNVSLRALADHAPEGPERAELRLVSAGGAAVTTSSAAQVVLRDADSMLVMAANITSGGSRRYEIPGVRIFQGLLPDVVAVQEFTPAHGTHREFVDEAFGTGFSFYVESEPDDTIPNGVISRWPIVAAGEWSDHVVHDRDFAWATLAIPGPRRLHVVSLHLYAQGRDEDRAAQAKRILSRIRSQFPAGDFLVVAGDLNTSSRSESAMAVFGELVSDARHPADQHGVRETNTARSKPLDYVLPNAALEQRQIPLRVEDVVFPGGLVFDSRLWPRPPPPISPSDAAATGMQHLPVVKLFSLEAAAGPP